MRRWQENHSFGNNNIQIFSKSKIHSKVCNKSLIKLSGMLINGSKGVWK